MELVQDGAVVPSGSTTLPGRLDVYVRRGDPAVGTLRVVDVADLAATETLTFRPGERLGRPPTYTGGPPEAPGP